MSDSPTKWLNTKQAADYSGYTLRGLENMRNEGRGPKYYKAGRCVRYLREDLDAFFKPATAGAGA